jgi:hypothetical protein
MEFHQIQAVNQENVGTSPIMQKMEGAFPHLSSDSDIGDQPYISDEGFNDQGFYGDAENVSQQMNVPK